jgi:hypothetical protein
MAGKRSSSFLYSDYKLTQTSCPAFYRMFKLMCRGRGIVADGLDMELWTLKQTYE